MVCPDQIPAPALTLNEFIALGGTADDDCGPVDFMFVGETNNGDTCPLIVTRIYRVIDACGNFADTTQQITVADDRDPLITAPAADAVACLGDLPAPAASLAGFEALGGTASDNCQLQSLEHVGDASDGQTCPETITRTLLLAQIVR